VSALRLSAAAATALAGALLVWFAAAPSAPPQPIVAPTLAQPAAAAATQVAPHTPALPAASAPMAFGAWMKQRSSLRGAELDGDWSRLDAHGQLVPALALRRRFDQLLTLQGEASIEQLQGFMADDVRALHGPAHAEQVLALWHRYLELLRYRFSSQIVPADRHSWAAALAERQPVRQRLLGVGWAKAFYEDEEAAMRRAGQGLPALSAASGPVVILPSGLDASTLDAAARERLAAEQAAWAEWERRLALARQQWQRLQNAPELSEVQRHDEFERWLPTQFDAAQARRVRALVLTSGG
jgi:hypothetical protein